jgi:hypothetical protein
VSVRRRRRHVRIFNPDERPRNAAAHRAEPARSIRERGDLEELSLQPGINSVVISNQTLVS